MTRKEEDESYQRGFAKGRALATKGRMLSQLNPLYLLFGRIMPDFRMGLEDGQIEGKWVREHE